MKTPTKFVAIAAALGAALAFSGCTEEGSSSTDADKKVSESALKDFQKAQPVPKFAYSQYRQNLIEILTAQTEATPTTTFFFNQGVQEPVNSCPSVGFPIPGTSQLTNPQQIEDRYEGDVAIPQVEPHGVFTGESTATYVICRDANGRGYAVSWEGNVQAVTGPAEWTGTSIELIGAPTGDFSTGK